MRPLRGDHCHCTACGEYFNSTAAFDMHRTGRHGVDRRCMTVDEMRTAGMAHNVGGWGSRNRAQKPVPRLQDRRSAPTRHQRSPNPVQPRSAWHEKAAPPGRANAA